MVEMALVDLSLSLKPRSHTAHLSNNCHDFDQSSILMYNTKISGLFSRVYMNK